MLSYTKTLMAMAAMVVAAGGAAALPSVQPNVVPTAVVAQPLDWCDEGWERVDPERPPRGYEECQHNKWEDFSCGEKEEAVPHSIPGTVACKPR